MADPVELEVHRRLGFLLKHAFLGLEALNDQALAPLDLSARELSVLMALADLRAGRQSLEDVFLRLTRTAAEADAAVASERAVGGGGRRARRPRRGAAR